MRSDTNWLVTSSCTIMQSKTNAGFKIFAMTTIKDVANRAGVSFKTVSRVINGHPNVSDAMRERVSRAIEELDYRPNILARNMRIQKTEYIGLITDQIITTPFSGAIIKGAHEAAWNRNMILLTINTDGQKELEAEAVKMLLERQVAGIIFAAMFHQKVEPPSNISDVPCILVDCFAPRAALPSIVPDEMQGGYDATEHLLERGHRRIAMINGMFGYPGTIGRLSGYRKALEKHGVSYDDDLVSFGGWWQEDGYEVARKILGGSNRPTAIFCGNDRIAMGVYDALRELDLRIPEDVAVVGFDNMEVIAAHLKPALTTMALPYYAMGQRAIECLTDADAPPNESMQIKMPCPLIRRAST